MFPQLVTSVNFFGNLVRTAVGVGICFGSRPVAFVSVQLMPSSVAGAVSETSLLPLLLLLLVSGLLVSVPSLPHPVKVIATIVSKIIETFL
jgi:hypothetical protein